MGSELLRIAEGFSIVAEGLRGLAKAEGGTKEKTVKAQKAEKQESVADAISAAIPSVASPNTHTSSHRASSSIPIAMPSRLSSSIPSFKNCGNKRCGATGRKPCSHAMRQ